jgi:5-methylcytosine-specific restriction endonuclease McrA
LKTYWDDESTGGRKASVCVGELRQALKRHDLAIDEDALVAAVSVVWAVAFRNGEILSDRDLLKGEVLSPMAKDLSKNWSLLVNAVEEVTRQARKREVVSVYWQYYKSLNPFAVLWAWRFLAARWWQSPNRGRTTDPIRNRFDEALGASLDEHMDRWLLCSHWAGMWSGSTSDAVARYARGLAGLDASLAQCHDWQQAVELLCDHLGSLVSGLQQGAIEHISTLQVPRRAEVKAYYSPLWIWHRLDERRWDVSKLTLRERSRAEPKLDVDHVVAVEMWPQLVGTSMANDLQGDVNALGNCMLLKSNFNKSKNKRSFGSFLEQALDPNGPMKPGDVAGGLCLANAQLYPEGTDLTDLRGLTQERGKTIKQDLVDFVNGRKKRVDPPSRDS